MGKFSMIALLRDSRMIHPKKEKRIRELLALGVPILTIAKEVEVSKNTVLAVKKNRNRQPLEDETVLEGAYRVHDRIQRNRKAQLKRTRTQCDNLISSLKYRWKGILAEEAGIYIPPEDQTPPS